jgi:hypothetical protein
MKKTIFSIILLISLLTLLGCVPGQLAPTGTPSKAELEKIDYCADDNETSQGTVLTSVQVLQAIWLSSVLIASACRYSAAFQTMSAIKEKDVLKTLVFQQTLIVNLILTAERVAALVSSASPSQQSHS